MRLQIKKALPVVVTAALTTWLAASTWAVAAVDAESTALQIEPTMNQRYATNSETAGLFRLLCEQSEVPLQAFVVRSDLACGSTIGPLTASNIGVRTLDIGVPTFAMHSIRELAGARDSEYLYRALKAFLGSTQK